MLSRLAVAAAVTVLTVGGIYAAGGFTNHALPSAGASPTATALASVPRPCNSQLIPNLLLTSGCTYASSEFVHPFTVRGDARWLSGGEFASGAEFTGSGATVEYAIVQLIVLTAVQAPISCDGGSAPPPPTVVPTSAVEYLAWLDTIAGVALPRQSTTFGGLPATRVDITSRETECPPDSYPGWVGQSGVGANGEMLEASCFGSCAVYVVEDGDLLLVATVSVQGHEGIQLSPPVAAFLDGLRFAP